MLQRYALNINSPDDYANLGIFQFARDFFPKRFTDKPALLHYEMAVLLFQLLNPRSEYSFERQRYMLVHREAAKSTFGSFLLPIYLIYMKGHEIYVDDRMLTWDGSVTITDHFKNNTDKHAVKILIDEPFIVIASETARRAERFVNSLKMEIETRHDMARVFGEKDPRVLEIQEDRRKTNKVWRVNSFVTKDNTVVFGIGSGQRIRGENEAGTRPTLIIVDDMYSGINTKTETSRENIRYWFHAELLNSLDSKKGKCLWLGTMVHPDTVVKDFRMDSNWQGVERPIVSMDELKSYIDKFTHNEMLTIPPKSQFKDLKATTLSWPERHPLYSILTKYKKHADQQKLNYFYQEFMNEAIAPELQYIGPQAFHQTHIYHRISDNRNILEFDYQGQHWIGTAMLYCGIDPAASTVIGSDDTVIVVAGLARMFPRTAGMDYMGSEIGRSRVFPIIMHLEGGKYSIRKYEALKSMGESLLRIEKEYKLEYINIDVQATQLQIMRELQIILREHNRNTNIWGETSSQLKAERIINTIIPILHKYGVCMCNNLPDLNTLYNQLLTVGVADHDDYPDALAIAWKRLQEPEFSPYFDSSNQEYNKPITRLDKLKNEYGEDYWMYV